MKDKGHYFNMKDKGHYFIGQKISEAPLRKTGVEQ